MISQQLQFMLDELRHVRAARGMRQEDLAKILKYSPSQVGMIETGARKPPPGFWESVDEALQTGGSFTRWADRLGTPRWKVEWESAEREAVSLRSYEALVVPGLLQTAAYARTVLTDAGLWSHDEVEKLLADRMARQEILARENPPSLTAVIDEGVLRREVGNPGIMNEQVDAIIKACAAPRIQVHVVPATAGAYVGLNGPFVLATARDRSVVGYIDNQLHGDVVDGAEEVTSLEAAWEAVRSEALPHRLSIDLMTKAVETWT